MQKSTSLNKEFVFQSSSREVKKRNVAKRAPMNRTPNINIDLSNHVINQSFMNFQRKNSICKIGKKVSCYNQ